MRLFLLPALGTDERIFSFLGKLSDEVVFPRLTVPLFNDSMETYASRLAEGLGIKDTDIVGGVSFGGMVAAEISCRRFTKGLILISSGLSSRSIDPMALRLGSLASRLPGKLLRAMLGSRKTFEKVFGPDQPPLFSLARQMLDDSPDQLLIQGGRLSLSYWPANQPLCPVHAIHGEKDRLMFPVEVADCRMVPGAGQGMVVTHAEDVTEFCARFCAGRSFLSGFCILVST